MNMVLNDTVILIVHDSMFCQKEIIQLKEKHKYLFKLCNIFNFQSFDLTAHF